MGSILPTNDFPPLFVKVHSVASCVLHFRPIHFCLNWLGYCSKPNLDERLIVTKHGKSAYIALARVAISYLVFEVAFAIVAIIAMFRFISEVDVALDIQLFFWISIGILRYFTSILGGKFKCHASKRMRKTKNGNVSVICNAVHIKRYKPYVIGIICAMFSLIVIGILYSSGVILSATHNLWLFPLVLGFFFFFVFACLLNCFDILCSICGFKPATFDLDRNIQLEQSFE